MAKWTGQITKAVTSTTVGVGALYGAASNMRRMRLLEFLCGSDAATLGTSNFRWEFTRSTSAPTGTGISPLALDPTDAVVIANLSSSLSANGTLTASGTQIMMTIPMSEQASFRYVANPGSEIVIPATASNGIHFLTPVCGNNPSAAAQVTFEEL